MLCRNSYLSIKSLSFENPINLKTLSILLIYLSSLMVTLIPSKSISFMVFEESFNSSNVYN